MRREGRRNMGRDVGVGRRDTNTNDACASACGTLGQNLGWLALATLGLTLVAVWSDVVGYSATLLPPGSAGEAAAFSWGRLAASVLFVVAPGFVHRSETWLMGAVAVAMLFGTALFAVSGMQQVIDPGALCAVTAFAGGVGFTMLSVPFFLLMARHARLKWAAAATAASLVAESVCSLALTFCSPAGVQVAVCSCAAPAAVACYLLCKVLVRQSAGVAVPRADEEGTDLDGHGLGGTGQMLLFAQYALSIIAAALLRSLGAMGAWGQNRGNYLGMSSLDWPVLLAMCAGIALVSLAVFVIPAKTSAQTRCTVGLVIVLGCLQLVALGGSLQTGPLAGIPMACQLFCRLLQWMLFLECVRRLDAQPYRIQGAASVCNALAGLGVGYALGLGASPTVVVTLFMYALALVSGGTLAHVIRRQRDALAALSRGVSQESPSAAHVGMAGSDTPDESEKDACLVRFSEAHGISARERQVLELLLRGCTRTEIGQALGLSEGTVRTHVNAVYHKAGVHAKRELQELYAHEAGPDQKA